MSGMGLIAIFVAVFALAIGLIQVLGRLIDSGGRDGWADEPPDTGGTAGDGRHRPGQVRVTAAPTGVPPGWRHRDHWRPDLLPDAHPGADR